MMSKAMGMTWFSLITQLLIGLIGFILLFFRKTNKGFNFGLAIPLISGNSLTDNITKVSTLLLVRNFTKL